MNDEHPEKTFTVVVVIMTIAVSSILLAASFGIVADSLARAESVKLCKTLPQELIPGCLSSIYQEP